MSWHHALWFWYRPSCWTYTMLPANQTLTSCHLLSSLKLSTPLARNATSCNSTLEGVELLDEVYHIVNSPVSCPSCILVYSCPTECILPCSMTQTHLLVMTRLCWSLMLCMHEGKSSMLNRCWVNVSPFNTSQLPSCIDSLHKFQNKWLNISNLLLVQSRWQWSSMNEINPFFPIHLFQLESIKYTVTLMVHRSRFAMPWSGLTHLSFQAQLPWQTMDYWIPLCLFIWIDLVIFISPYITSISFVIYALCFDML